ncbi:hypothetical protein ACEPUM_09555 [Pseudomonas aeruginosa]
MTLVNQLVMASAIAALQIALLFFFVRAFAADKASHPDLVDDVCTLDWPRPKTGGVL